MIALDTASVTTTSATRNGVTTATVVDTLRVRYVELSLVEGSILAIIERGQMVPVPAVGDAPATAEFRSMDDPLWVDVRPDGSFASRDGAWTGKVDSAPQITAGLKAAFDGFLLASGAVSGKVV